MTKIFAHRGASFKYPENTMSAFKQAYHEGADGIELDVQLTRDRVPVVIHDERVDRTTNGVGLVKGFSLKELQKLQVVQRNGWRKSFSYIPTLEEVLDWISQTDMVLNIEFKNSVVDYEGMEELVLHLVHQYQMLGQSVFSSFNHESLRVVKRHEHKAETALLFKRPPLNLIRYAKSMGADGVHPHKRNITRSFLTEMQTHDLRVRAYTVNSTAAIRRMADWGITGVITDMPGKAVNILQRMKT